MMMKAFGFALLLVLATFVQNGCAFVTTTATRLPSTSQLEMTKLTYGSKSKDFKPGSPLKTAVKQLGVKVKYSCTKGDCATCQVSVAGRAMRPCVAKVPDEPRLKSLQEKGLEIRG
mmetsp:Transcript_1170/g.2325  ORF Transcript_1170/g.2325 Transcript_1170/m.2325 type:complete len:116 (-) Transcript_1170:1203-1550(-)